MSAIHADLYELAGAAAIIGSDRYRLLGSERKIAAADDGPARTMLLKSLEAEMYYRLYRRPDGGWTGAPPTSSVDTMRTFTAALSKANAGSGTWDPGWRIEARAGDDHVQVWRDGVRYRACATDVRRQTASDEACRVRVPKELRQLVRGFYMALGDADWPDAFERPGALLRCYWSLEAHAAPFYLAEMTRRLNARRVPFRTKVVQDPNNYLGADSGVLYLPSDAIEPLWSEIRDVYALIKNGLRSHTPMFAQRLAPGLAYAEDPGDGMSFGQARCKIAADGLWRAFSAGEHRNEDRAAHVALAFAENGIDPDAPFRTRSSDCPRAPANFAA